MNEWEIGKEREDGEEEGKERKRLVFVLTTPFLSLKLRVSS